ncbi:MAG TPA: hypothetical protein VN947_03290 [Polyangia bacterium]|nr:hypothetical protein [Polyangia bacterium]
MIGGDERQPAGDQHGGAVAEDVDGGAGGALVGREQIGAVGVGGDVLAGGAEGDADGERGERQRRGARRQGAERDQRGAESELKQDDPAAAAAGERRAEAIDERRPQALERISSTTRGRRCRRRR